MLLQQAIRGFYIKQTGISWFIYYTNVLYSEKFMSTLMLTLSGKDFFYKQVALDIQ